MTMSVKRGDIFYADLSPVVGSEQGGLRPVLIVQNDVGNKYSPTVIAAAITSRIGKTKLPTHIDVRSQTGSYDDVPGLAKDSVILLEQIRTLDKRRLKERMGHIDDYTMRNVDNALSVSFGLGNGFSTPSYVGVTGGNRQNYETTYAASVVGNSAELNTADNATLGWFLSFFARYEHHKKMDETKINFKTSNKTTHKKSKIRGWHFTILYILFIFIISGLLSFIIIKFSINLLGLSV